MPFPENKKEFRFLGIKYLGKFVHNLSENTENFQKRTQCSTLTKIKKELDKRKLLVISPPVLKFYNPLLPIKVSSGASEKGLGTEGK